MKDTALVQVALDETRAKAVKYGWDSRYGGMYKDLIARKGRLRHMLYHCFTEHQDEQAGMLMDSPLFVD